MVSTSLLLVFIGALAVVYALPGPDMALVLQTSSAHGLRHGLATGLGLAIARTTHVILSACGVAALLRSAPWLYSGVRVVGALYLAYIAIQIFRSPAFGLGPTGVAGTAQRAWRTSIGKGMLSCMLNPKALLFCSVLMPQFIVPAQGRVWLQVVELGVVLVLCGALFDIALSLGASRIASWIRHHPRAQVVQRWTFSAALLAFAVRLSID
jgi:threonine/homoserine/homoserine lactone efflux protein